MASIGLARGAAFSRLLLTGRPGLACHGSGERTARADVCSPSGRGMSSQAGPRRGACLKTQMRKLYKMVHPDLFHGHPSAKEANEKSFKLLQQFISNATQTEARAHVERLTFYLKHEDEQSQDPGLRKVDVDLPPVRLARAPTAGSASKEIHPGLAPVLNRLLRAVGLDTVAAMSPAESAASGGAFRDFLSHALDLAHRTGPPPAQRHLDMVRSALRMMRGITVTLSSNVGDGRNAPNTGLALSCAQGLMRVLDGDPSLDLSGLRLRVGDATTVTELGVLCVNARELCSEDAWSAFLASETTGALLEGARRRAAMVAEVRRREDAAARSMGVGSVSCDLAHAGATAACLDWLRNAEQEASDRGPLAGEWGATFGHVHVLVQACRQDGEGLSVRQTDGTVVVPLPLSARALWPFAQSESGGGQARRLSARHQWQREQREKLSKLVRSRLRLRSLAHDDRRVSASQFTQCAERMVRMSTTLGPLMEGARIRISDANRLPSEQREAIDVAWDFDL